MGARVEQEAVVASVASFAWSSGPGGGRAEMSLAVAEGDEMTGGQDRIDQHK